MMIWVLWALSSFSSQTGMERILQWNTERQIFLPLITNRHCFTNTSIFSMIWRGAFLIRKFLCFLASCLMLIIFSLPQLIREQVIRWIQPHSYFYRSLSLTQQTTPAFGPPSVGTPMEGSGLQEALEQIIAKISVPQVLSGKAQERAFRAQMLAATALNHIILKMVLYPSQEGD